MRLPGVPRARRSHGPGVELRCFLPATAHACCVLFTSSVLPWREFPDESTIFAPRVVRPFVPRFACPLACPIARVPSGASNRGVSRLFRPGLHSRARQAAPALSVLQGASPASVQPPQPAPFQGEAARRASPRACCRGPRIHARIESGQGVAGAEALGAPHRGAFCACASGRACAPFAFPCASTSHAAVRSCRGWHRRAFRVG